MSSALIALAVQVGAPIVQRILSERIGSGNSQLAVDVIGAIAKRTGVPVGDLEAVAQNDPGPVMRAIKEVEVMAPEMMQVILAETATREALLMQEAKSGGWKAAWRPLWMFLLGFLWLWNLVILHAINAIAKTALPQTDLSILMQVTGIFAGLYMGGHTIKEAVKSWRGSK